MTIVCTKEQKEWFIWQAECKEFCPFMSDKSVVCHSNCKECIENNIDWEITDEVTDKTCGTCKYKDTCTNESFCFGNDWAEDKESGNDQ